MLLVGGDLGVFRAFAPQASVQWTEVGTNLPNALVDSIAYVQPSLLNYAVQPTMNTGPMLVVGTQGRGAWTLSNANVVLAQQPVLTITGTAAAENVTIVRNAANASLLDVSVNGTKILETSVMSVSSIVFNGGGGDDTLTVDSTNGSIPLPGGIHFTGGAGADTLTLTGEAVQSVDTATAGSQNTYTVTDAQGGATEHVVFEDFTSGTDTFTNSLPTASVWERIVDGLVRWWTGYQTPADTSLAVLGATLPNVITGAVAAGESPVSDAPAGGPEDDDTADAVTQGQGLQRLFTFDDGRSLLDELRDGTIHDLASLLTELGRLAGGSATNLGTDTDPRIEFTTTKNLSGSGDFNVAFDESAGTCSSRARWTRAPTSIST